LHSEIYIKKEELRVFGGENISDLKENCSMSLHRNSCSNPALLPLETITWNTRICFRWKCLIAQIIGPLAGFLRLIGAPFRHFPKSDWGSFQAFLSIRLGPLLDINREIAFPRILADRTNIIYFTWWKTLKQFSGTVSWFLSQFNCNVFIRENNRCSSETALISSPKYERGIQTATSLGWLSIRQVGYSYLHLSCDIRLCHICSNNCSSITPPIACSDYSQSYIKNRENNFWNSSEKFLSACHSNYDEEKFLSNQLNTSSFFFVPLLLFIYITQYFYFS
uniref:ZP domain-containing protein n=1 Tax=Dracunculus medinensis TaxID=318479 RepID=A0A0N4U1S5_DRAME